MYMKHAHVVSGIVGNSVSKGGKSPGGLYDSSVYRKVGTDFYPWWVKLTYNSVTDHGNWQSVKLTATDTNGNDGIVPLQSMQLYHLKETPSNVPEGYDFQGWTIGG